MFFAFAGALDLIGCAPLPPGRLPPPTEVFCGALVPLAPGFCEEVAHFMF